MSLTVSEIARSVFGNKRIVISEVTFDSSYATGGEALTAATLGLSTIDALFVDAGAAAAGTTGVVVKYDKTNSKLQAFGAPASSTHTHTGAAHTHNTDAHTHPCSATEVTAGATLANAPAAGASTTPGAGGTGGSITAGSANLGQVASTTDLSLLKVVVLAIGI